MKTTLDLLNEVVRMGFERERALESIDKSLDDCIGIENRKELENEFLDEETYNTMLSGFEQELD